MFDALIKKVVKKFVIGKINDLLKKYKDDIATVREILARWIGRTQKILDCLKSLSKKIEDNELDENELKETTEEIIVVVKEW